MENNKNLQNDINHIKARLRQIEMRIIAVKAMEDSGAGIEEELAELLPTVKSMKENQREKEVMLILEKLQEAIEANIGYIEARKTDRMLNLPEIDEAAEEIKQNPEILAIIPPAAKLSSQKSPEQVIDVLVQGIEQLKSRLQTANSTLVGFVSSEKWKNLTQLFPDIEDYFKVNIPQDPISTLFMVEFINNLDNLQPFIEEEVKKLGVSSISFLDFVRDTDPTTGEKVKSLLSICWGKAFGETRNTESRPQAAVNAEIRKPKSILPNRYVMMNTAISNALSKTRKNPETGEMVPVINSGAFNLPVMRSGKSGEVTAYVMITLEDESDLTITGKPFTRYDNCVLNAIVTLWEAGNEVVTPESIARAMAHRTNSEYISPQQQGAITKSIEKMRRIFVKADLSEEMKKRNITDDQGNPIEKFTINNALLILDQITVKISGRERMVYKITKEPPLLTYSKMIGRTRETGQLITVNADLMDVKKLLKNGTISPESISTSETRQQIKEYLLQRIEVMKYARRNKHSNQSNRILFDTLYSEVNISFSKTETQRTRKFVFQALDYWNAKGYINGYEIVKAGSQIKAVDIKF